MGLVLFATLLNLLESVNVQGHCNRFFNDAQRLQNITFGSHRLIALCDSIQVLQRPAKSTANVFMYGNIAGAPKLMNGVGVSTKTCRYYKVRVNRYFIKILVSTIVILMIGNGFIVTRITISRTRELPKTTIRTKNDCASLIPRQQLVGSDTNSSAHRTLRVRETSPSSRRLRNTVVRPSVKSNTSPVSQRYGSHVFSKRRPVQSTSGDLARVTSKQTGHTMSPPENKKA